MVNFNENIDLFVATDRNNADTLNQPIEKAIENTKHNKEQIETIKEDVAGIHEKFDEYTPTVELNDLLATGIKGDKGEQGYSAYEVAVQGGFEGTKEEWLTSLKGEKGEQGDVSMAQLEEVADNLQAQIEGLTGKVLWKPNNWLDLSALPKDFGKGSFAFLISGSSALSEIFNGYTTAVLITHSFNENFTCQYAFTLDTKCKAIKYRLATTVNTWGEWQSVYSTSNKPTPSDIGALPTTGGTVDGNLMVTGNLNLMDSVEVRNGGSDKNSLVVTANDSIYLRPKKNGSSELVVTDSKVTFNGHDVYHKGNKPTPAEIGAIEKFNMWVDFGTQENITTEQFISVLNSKGAFNNGYWVARGSWSYANNQLITDTGCGNIHLAGCVIEVFSVNTTHYTIKVTTPTTSVGGTNSAEFIYVNNGSIYSPKWRRSYNTENKPTPAEIGAIPTNASCNKNWNWAGQGGQPYWLWGSNDGTNMYVYNPSNFNVNYANSAGNADTLDGLHSSSFAPSGFGLGTASRNISGGDWNNAIESGYYMGSNMANAPNSDWWMGHVICHNSGWIIQRICAFSSTQQWMTRYKLNGNWTAWTNDQDTRTYKSTASPSGGVSGDVWIKYS